MTRDHFLSSAIRFVLQVVLIGYFFAAPGFSQEAANKKKAGKKDPLAAVKAMDRNKNGYLEADEIPEQHRGKLTNWAKSKGLDTSKPLPLKSLLSKAPKQKSSKEEKEAIKAVKKAERQRTKEQTSEESSKKNAKAFGAARNQDKAQAKNDDAEKKKRDASKRAFQIAARSLMYQNDKNKNKRLEKSEWSRLKGDPSKADTNRDGSLSMEELTAHLAGYGSREEKPRPKYRIAKRTKGTTTKKSYRFLTPHERLPDGLPDWFIERDDNLDGQLSLREYAPSLTAAKYRKFRQLDLNGDGFLLAKEYLAATK